MVGLLRACRQGESWAMLAGTDDDTLQALSASGYGSLFSVVCALTRKCMPFVRHIRPVSLTKPAVPPPNPRVINSCIHLTVFLLLAGSGGEAAGCAMLSLPGHVHLIGRPRLAKLTCSSNCPSGKASQSRTLRRQLPHIQPGFSRWTRQQHVRGLPSIYKRVVMVCSWSLTVQFRFVPKQQFT